MLHHYLLLFILLWTIGEIRPVGKVYFYQTGFAEYSGALFAQMSSQKKNKDIPEGGSKGA